MPNTWNVSKSLVRDSTNTIWYLTPESVQQLAVLHYNLEKVIGVSGGCHQRNSCYFLSKLLDILQCLIPWSVWSASCEYDMLSIGSCLVSTHIRLEPIGAIRKRYLNFRNLVKSLAHPCPNGLDLWSNTSSHGLASEHKYLKLKEISGACASIHESG